MEEYLLARAYMDYNPDEDPNGSIGMGIADAISRRYNYDLRRLKVDMSLKRLERTIFGKNGTK